MIDRVVYSVEDGYAGHGVYEDYYEALAECTLLNEQLSGEDREDEEAWAYVVEVTLEETGRERAYTPPELEALWERE